MRTTALLLTISIGATGALLAQPLPYDIVDAAKRGDDHAVRRLLENNPARAETRDAHGYTALHWAGVRAHWTVFVQLVDAGAPVNAVGGDGGTPLHWAAHHDRADMVALLIAKGADVSVSNNWGRTPLHVAARRGCATVASTLLDAGADPNATTNEGWTPLHVAYLSGQPELVALLLARGADPEQKDADGKRPRERAFERPQAVAMTQRELDEYGGHYDLGGGFGIKVWREGGRLNVREFAPDELYPIGPGEFYCRREPWRLTFRRDEAGEVASVDVAFLRRTVTGKRRDHPLYVGSHACKQCHYDEEHGEYMQWIASRHAAAYWRLATDWAGLLASLRPAYRDVDDPIADSRCLLCHTTAAQDPDALMADPYRVSEGVGCEACHGPGSSYMDRDVMSSRGQFLSHGGVVPDETTCRKCHRDPERFDFQSWWQKIDHKRVPEDSGGAVHGE
jgi:hypothetical protein